MGPGGQAGSSEFVVNPPAVPPGGLRIQPYQAPLPFQVRYTPADIGADTGAVALELGDGYKQWTWVESLTGRGDGSNLQTDVFMQERPPMSDILLVIDNSPSMVAHQASVAANLDALLQVASLSLPRLPDRSDHRRPRAGRRLSERTDTSRNNSEQVDAESRRAKFANKVNVGVSGTGSPRCLEQTLSALSSPLIDSQNAGFLRDGAHLSPCSASLILPTILRCRRATT